MFTEQEQRELDMAAEYMRGYQVRTNDARDSAHLTDDAYKELKKRLDAAGLTFDCIDCAQFQQLDEYDLVAKFGYLLSEDEEEDEETAGSAILCLLRGNGATVLALPGGEEWLIAYDG